MKGIHAVNATERPGPSLAILIKGIDAINISISIRVEARGPESASPLQISLRPGLRGQGRPVNPLQDSPGGAVGQGVAGDAGDGRAEADGEDRRRAWTWMKASLFQ